MNVEIAMSKFKFRLKKVREVKEIYEEQAKLKWASAKQELLLARDRLTALTNKRKTSLEYGYQNLDIKLRPALYNYIEQIDKQITAQEQVCIKAADKEKHAMSLWMKARQEKEMILRLEEKKFEEYRYEVLRKEQNQLDEIQNLVPQI